MFFSSGNLSSEVLLVLSSNCLVVLLINCFIPHPSVHFREERSIKRWPVLSIQVSSFVFTLNESRRCFNNPEGVLDQSIPRLEQSIVKDHVHIGIGSWIVHWNVIIPVLSTKWKCIGQSDSLPWVQCLWIDDIIECRVHDIVSRLQHKQFSVHHIEIIPRTDHARVGAEGYFFGDDTWIVEVEFISFEDTDHGCKLPPSRVSSIDIIESIIHLDHSRAEIFVVQSLLKCPTFHFFIKCSVCGNSDIKNIPHTFQKLERPTIQRMLRTPLWIKIAIHNSLGLLLQRTDELPERIIGILLDHLSDPLILVVEEIRQVLRHEARLIHHVTNVQIHIEEIFRCGIAF